MYRPEELKCSTWIGSLPNPIGSTVDYKPRAVAASSRVVLPNLEGGSVFAGFFCVPKVYAEIEECTYSNILTQKVPANTASKVSVKLAKQ